MDTQVLIVGAGPTGLMLANQLARRGIRPMIIDRHSGPAQQSRAMAVQARTLEIYNKLGVADEAVALGAPALRFPITGTSRSSAFSFSSSGVSGFSNMPLAAIVW